MSRKRKDYRLKKRDKQMDLIGALLQPDTIQ